MTTEPRSLFQFLPRIAYVPPSRFIGGRSYLLPRRITLRGPGRLAIYRWLCWNVAIGRGR